MRKINKLFLVVAVLMVAYVGVVGKAQAQDNCSLRIADRPTLDSPVIVSANNVVFDGQLDTSDTDNSYYLDIKWRDSNSVDRQLYLPAGNPEGGVLQPTEITNQILEIYNSYAAVRVRDEPQSFAIILVRDNNLFDRRNICRTTVEFQPTIEQTTLYYCSDIDVSFTHDGSQVANFRVVANGNFQTDMGYRAWIGQSGDAGATTFIPLESISGSMLASRLASVAGGVFRTGQGTVVIAHDGSTAPILDITSVSAHQGCIANFNMDFDDEETDIPTEEADEEENIHVVETTGDGEGTPYSLESVPFAICQQAGDKSELCIECAADGTKIWTAVGCIPTDQTGMIKAAITLGVSMAGGVGVLMILAGAFLLSTSKGDPKKTEEAKNLITAVVIGLLFIIFSITILRFIGVTIFKIPGFGDS